MSHDELALDDVKRVARLARLRLTDEQARRYRVELGAVLKHVEELDQMDLDGVEPMHSPIDAPVSMQELADDQPRPSLTGNDLERIAPEMDGPYLRVPKVISGGGASA
ncbi:MAG: Asp-tRNA(Asn)/Glu-tRNA(Gln) amidotransferase subunit GatC [Planctomycetota bacterium]